MAGKGGFDPLGSPDDPSAAGLYGRIEPGYLLGVACPTPNLGSGAHAAGISEAKGAQPSGCFGSTPSGRARGG